MQPNSADLIGGGVTTEYFSVVAKFGGGRLNLVIWPKDE